MVRQAVALALALLPGALTSAARAQSISVSPSALTLDIPYVTGGYGTAVDVSTRLSWIGTRGNHTAKIAVGTTAPGQVFTLRVLATEAYGGEPAGTVTLRHGATAAELIRNIPQRATGLATLRFEASVPAGYNGTRLQDIHTVVYTITRQ